MTLTVDVTGIPEEIAERWAQQRVAEGIQLIRDYCAPPVLH